MDNMHARMRGAEPQIEPVEEKVPAPSHRYSPRVVAEKPAKKWLPTRWRWAVLAALVVAMLGFGGYQAITNGNDGIDHGKYQAVFLVSSSLPSNVYFGKLERMPNGYYRLTQVYYLRNQTADKTKQDNTNITLTKMSTELHSPDDSLVLPREQILYYQNMQDSSKVVAAIKQDLQQK